MGSRIGVANTVAEQSSISIPRIIMNMLIMIRITVLLSDTEVRAFKITVGRFSLI